MLKQVTLQVLLIVDAENDDRDCCEEHVVDLEQIDVVDSLSRPARKHSSANQRHRVDHVLVEVVADQIRVSAVAFTAMVKNKWAQLLELAD